MNLDQLNTIVKATFNAIEADAVIVLHSSENGIQVFPLWEHSYEFSHKDDMIADLEMKLIELSMNFADNNAGNTIGTYAMNWTDKE